MISLRLVVGLDAGPVSAIGRFLGGDDAAGSDTRHGIAVGDALRIENLGSLRLAILTAELMSICVVSFIFDYLPYLAYRMHFWRFARGKD